MESNKKLAELKALYAQCFSDSKQVADFLFSTKLGIQNAVTSILNGQVVGALYLVEKQLVYLDAKTKYPFIVALGTSAEHRGKGIAGSIIKQALAKIYASNLPFVGLYPAITGFYEKYQFTFITQERALCKEGLDFVTTQDSALLLSLYQDALAELDFYYSRTQEEMDFRLAEIAADNGKAQLIYSQGKLTGYELGGGEEYVLHNNINCDTSGKPINGHMARIVSLAAAFALTNISIPFSFQVQDHILTQNNMTISVKNGIISNSNTANKNIKIEDLTALFFGIMPENAKAFHPYFKKIKGQIAEKY